VLVQQPDQELGGGLGRGEVDADEQALAADLGDQVRAVGRDRVGGSVADLGAKFAGPLEQALGFDGGDGGGDRGGGERAASEGGGVQQRVGVQRREQLRGRGNAADWHHAAAKDFACQQHVRDHAGQVSAPPGAKPAHAGLDFVEDHHSAGAGARLPDLRQVAAGRQPDAGFGLDRFQQHRRLGRQHRLQRGQITELDEVHHRQQRAERVAVLRPPGHRQRAECLAVEPALHRDHMPLAGQPRQLQPDLGRLGPGVGQKHIIQAGRGDAGHVRCRLGQLRVEEQPRGQGVTRNLLAHRRDHSRMAVAEQEHPKAAAVKIGVPVAAPHLRPGRGHLHRRPHQPRQARQRRVHMLGITIQHPIPVGWRGPRIAQRPARARRARRPRRRGWAGRARRWSGTPARASHQSSPRLVISVSIATFKRYLPAPSDADMSRRISRHGSILSSQSAPVKQLQ
jgi:hypothetical protein